MDNQVFEFGDIKVTTQSKEEWEKENPERAAHFKMLDESSNQRKRECSEEITCDLCNIHICWSYAWDLNGSYFNCDSCRAANPSPPIEYDI